MWCVPLRGRTEGLRTGRRNSQGRRGPATCEKYVERAEKEVQRTTKGAEPRSTDREPKPLGWWTTTFASSQE